MRLVNVIEQRPLRVDAKVLLAAMDSQATEAVGLAAEAQTQAVRCAVVPYLRFRKKIEEFRSVVSLLEDRLGSMEPERAQALRTNFERLDMLVLMLTIRTARTVFRTLLSSGGLPLCARDILVPDVMNLRDAGQRLTRPPYAEMLSARVAGELEDAVAALREIFTRVPELPDFDDLPGPPPPEGKGKSLFGQRPVTARPAPRGAATAPRPPTPTTPPSAPDKA